MAEPIEIWCWDADAEPGDEALLSAEEIARARKFKFDVDRRRYIASHSMIRRALGAFMDQAPDALRFSAGAHGKPSIVGGPEFNFSDSAAMGLLAISPHLPIGADIEHVRPRAFGVEKLAEAVFTAAEQERLAAMPEAGRPAAFYRGWTRKEALLKAIGSGFSINATAFDVSMGENEAPRLNWADPAIEADPAAWTLQSLNTAPGFEAALAIRNGGAGLRLVMRSVMGACERPET